MITDKILRIAEVAHTVNKSYCEAIEDNNQPEWKNAPEWQTDSVIHGVEFILNNPDATPEDTHNYWLKYKTSYGWVHGPEKNEQKQTHPCLVPFDELPSEQRAKTFIFNAIVKCLR